MVSVCRVFTFVKKIKNSRPQQRDGSAMLPRYHPIFPKNSEHSNFACNGAYRLSLLLFTTAAPKRKAHRNFGSALSLGGTLCQPVFANSRFFTAFP